MSNRFASYLVVAALLVLSAMVAGCGDHSVSGVNESQFLSPSPLPKDETSPAAVPTSGVTVTAVSPPVGSAAGATQVTISGSGFHPNAVLTIDGVRAQKVGFPDSTKIVALTPPHTAGPVDVVVTNEDGQKGTLRAAYTYAFDDTQGPPPVITSVSPSIGTTAGGVAITLSGSGFREGATVTVGGLNATFGGRAALLNGSLWVNTPPHSAGIVSVVVTNPDGQRGTLANSFVYPPQGSFDFNGVWEGGAGVEWEMPVAFTIRSNVVVAISCWDKPLTFTPATVSNGEFTVLDGGTVIMTGRIKSATEAIGTISNDRCPRTTFVGDNWVAWKQHP